MKKFFLLSFVGIFSFLGAYSRNYYSAGPNSIYRGKVDKYVKVYEKIADSLESIHSFTTDPDSTNFIKGFVLFINEDKKTDEIIVNAHKFTESYYMIAFGEMLEKYDRRVKPILCQRDSVYYFFWGKKSSFFATSLGVDIADLVKKEGIAHSETMEKWDQAFDRDNSNLSENDKLVDKYFILQNRESRILNDRSFIEFELTPIYSTERGRRNEIIDWKLK